MISLSHKYQVAVRDLFSHLMYLSIGHSKTYSRRRSTRILSVRIYITKMLSVVVLLARWELWWLAVLLRHGIFFVVKRDMLSFEVSGVSESPCQLMDPAIRKYRLKAWRHYPSSRRSRSGGLKVHQPMRMTKVRKLVQILADIVTPLKIGKHDKTLEWPQWQLHTR